MANVNKNIELTVLQKIMESFQAKNAEDKRKLEFKSQVIDILRAEGCGEKFIQLNVTDNAIEDALVNNFDAESLAWAIMQ